MSEKIPARFRKTKTEKWAVMAPVEDLEQALEKGGKVDVLKRNGDWSTFQIASLGRPFDVDGVQMCYGYGPEDTSTSQASTSSGGAAPRRSGPAPIPPPPDPTEPLPEFQGAADDEWQDSF